jgi:hypothetical protein
MLGRLGFVLVLVLVCASAALASGPRLTAMPGAQVGVRGFTFHPGEHVVVVISSGGEHATRRLTAGTGGGFVARFPSIELAPCAAFMVRATGDEGSRAALRVAPPECPQPPTP